MIHTLAPLIHLITIHFNTGITNPFRKHSTMPIYENWSCILKLHMRPKCFKHLYLHPTHYNGNYRRFLTLCPTTPLCHPNLKPCAILCDPVPCIHTPPPTQTRALPTVARGDTCTALDDLFFDVSDTEEETDYLDDLFFAGTKDWDCNSCHANSSSDPDYPCPTPDISSYLLKLYAYRQTTLALSRLQHCCQLHQPPTSSTVPSPSSSVAASTSLHAIGGDESDKSEDKDHEVDIVEDKDNEVEVFDPTYPAGGRGGNTHHDIEMSGTPLDLDTFFDTLLGPFFSVDPIPNLAPTVDPTSYPMPMADPTLIPDTFPGSLNDEGSIFFGGGAKWRTKGQAKSIQRRQRTERHIKQIHLHGQHVTPKCFPSWVVMLKWTPRWFPR